MLLLRNRSAETLAVRSENLLVSRSRRQVATSTTLCSDLRGVVLLQMLPVFQQLEQVCGHDRPNAVLSAEAWRCLRQCISLATKACRLDSKQNYHELNIAQHIFLDALHSCDKSHCQHKRDLDWDVSRPCGKRGCFKVGCSKKCAQCGIHYCSEDYQRDDWPQHKQICTRLSRTRT